MKDPHGSIAQAVSRTQDLWIAENIWIAENSGFEPSSARRPKSYAMIRLDLSSRRKIALRFE